MTIKFESLKVNDTDSVWVEAPDIPGLRLCVKSTGNSEYKTAAGLELQKVFRKYGAATPPNDEIASVVGRLLAEHILVGWEGMDLEYSKENALKLLTDPAYRPLRESVEEAARQLSKPTLEFIDAAVKN